MRPPSRRPSREPKWKRQKRSRKRLRKGSRRKPVTRIMMMPEDGTLAVEELIAKVKALKEEYSHVSLEWLHRYKKMKSEKWKIIAKR